MFWKIEDLKSLAVLLVYLKTYPNHWFGRSASITLTFWTPEDTMPLYFTYKVICRESKERGPRPESGGGPLYYIY